MEYRKSASGFINIFLTNFFHLKSIQPVVQMLRLKHVPVYRNVLSSCRRQKGNVWGKPALIYLSVPLFSCCCWLKPELSERAWLNAVKPSCSAALGRPSWGRARQQEDCWCAAGNVLLWAESLEYFLQWNFSCFGCRPHCFCLFPSFLFGEHSMNGPDAERLWAFNWLCYPDKAQGSQSRAAQSAVGEV